MNEYTYDTLEQDIYTEDGMEDSMDNGEISPWEEGFMIGYLAA